MQLSKTEASLNIGTVSIFVLLSFSSAYSQNESDSEINPESIQIFLRNDTSGLPAEDRTYDIIIPIITASGAISGAILGTYFTGRHTMKLEERRIKEQQNKDTEFYQRVRRLVYVELSVIYTMLDGFYEKSALSDKARAAFKTMMNIVRQYPNLPLETKVSSFSPKAIENIEEAFLFFYVSSEIFKVAFPKFESGEITLEELKERLNLKSAMELFQDAIQSLEADDKKLKSVDTDYLRASKTAT